MVEIEGHHDVFRVASDVYHLSKTVRNFKKRGIAELAPLRFQAAWDAKD